MTNILTLHLDAASQAHFDRLRERHYPAALNQIAAHLTLFHTLPDTDEMTDVVHRIAGSQAAFALRVTGLRSLGKGVAYTLSSPALQTLHAQLAEEFAEHLSAQDRQRFMPHVVVQNKVTPERAHTLLAELQAGFQPFTVQAEGLNLWNYLGGPWELAASMPFQP